MLKYMKTIQTDERPKVLLLGNGINRAFDAEEWDQLLKNMACTAVVEKWDVFNNMSYPLKVVVATEDHVNIEMKKLAAKFTEIEPEEEKKELLRVIKECNFDAILTTNYTYELEKAWNPDFEIKVGRSSKYRFKTYKDKPKAETEYLYEYISVDEELPPIWHIHGEAAKPNTMIIGHYYYGKLLGKIQKYIPNLIKRYSFSEKNKTPFYPVSWVDYLLYGDVYILGQGLDYSEMDLWWLFCSKKRRKTGKIYIFSSDFKEDKLLLAQSYGLEIINEDKTNEEEYKHYYRRILEKLTKAEDKNGSI